MAKKIFAILGIIFAAVFANAAESPEQVKFAVLAIEYVGESDKPITPILVGDSKAGVEWGRTDVLKRSGLEFLSTNVVSAPVLGLMISEAERYGAAADRELGTAPQTSRTISVTVVRPGGRQAFLLNVKVAAGMLSALMKSCGDSRDLCADLSYFQRRILAQ